MCGRHLGKNFLTDDIGRAQMVPELRVECLIKDRDALLTFYDFPLSPQYRAALGLNIQGFFNNCAP